MDRKYYNFDDLLSVYRKLGVSEAKGMLIKPPTYATLGNSPTRNMVPSKRLTTQQ